MLVAGCGVGEPGIQYRASNGLAVHLQRNDSEQMKEYLDLIKTIADLGGSTVIAALMIWCIYKLLERFGTAFIQAHQQIAESIGAQARCMSEMREGIDNFIQKDNSEHREILLGLQVVGAELKALIEEIRDMRKESK